MAVGTLTVQSVSGDGLEVAMAAATATDGDQFVNNGRTFLQIANGSAGAVVASVKSYAAAGSGNDDDLEVSIAAGKTILIGPFNTSRFNSAGKGLVICTAAADVTLAAVKV